MEQVEARTAMQEALEGKLAVNGAVIQQRQAYPLDVKIELSLNRIRHWYDRYQGSVYVAFSGGKDSTVLLHLVRSVFPKVPAVFVDTGLEYPELREFVKSTENVTIVKPEMTFKQTLEQYGVPVISKQVANAIYRIRAPKASLKDRRKTLYGDERGSFGRLPKKWRFLLDAPFPISDKCCETMKTRPILAYHKAEGRAAFVGIMAEDSQKRMYSYMKKGCYQTDLVVPKCLPMAFWKEGDVWQYIRTNNIPYASVYDMGVKRTGCMFCCFGVHEEKEPNRFQLMKNTHPKQYDYCMNKLGLAKVMDFIGVKYGDVPASQCGQCGLSSSLVTLGGER